MDVSTWNAWSASTTPCLWHVLQNSTFQEFEEKPPQRPLRVQFAKGSGKQLQKKGGGGGGGLVAGMKRRPGTVHEGYT